jgi:hypothetical protein
LLCPLESQRLFLAAWVPVAARLGPQTTANAPVVAAVVLILRPKKLSFLEKLLRSSSALAARVGLERVAQLEAPQALLRVRLLGP